MPANYCKRGNKLSQVIGAIDILLIRDLIRVVTDIFFIVLLFRREFRFSLPLTIVIMVSVNVASFATYYLKGSLFTIHVLIMTCGIFIVYFAMIEKNRVNCWSLMFLFQTIPSILVSVFVGTFSGIAAFVSGSGEWYVVSENGIGMKVFMCISGIISGVISYFIIRKMKPYVLRFGSPVKWFLFTLAVIIPFTADTIKNAIVNIQEYTNDPSGIGFMLDSVFLLSTIISILLIIFNVVRIRRKDKQEADSEIQKLYSDYMEIKETKNQISEISHDIRNQIH